MFKIYPYINGSKSVRLLSQVLEARVLRRQGTRWRGTLRDYVINWGSQAVPNTGARVLNDPQRVAGTANKIRAFEAFARQNVRTVPWTTDQRTAQGWVDAGDTVVARALVSASEGRGITIVKPGERAPRVPLYTKYVKKKYEYRIHVMGGQVIDEVEKRLRRGGTVSPIRNTANGYVFARNDVRVPEAVRRESILAVQALQLDFGAVDVVYNERLGQAYVLEVNTAPGIEGSTVERYSNAFKRLYT